MKRFCIKFIHILLVLMLLSSVASAMDLSNYIPVGDEAITVNTAIGFTASKLTVTSGSLKGRPVDAALVTVETDQIRWRVAGTPTASVGHLMNVGDSLLLWGSTNVRSFLAIKVTNNASIYVTYYCLKP